MIRAFCVSFAALASIGSAWAEPEFSVSGGYSFLNLDEVDLNAVTVRGTAFFNENVGIEGEFSTGLGKEEFGFFSAVELKNQYSAFVIGRLPLAENFDLLGRVGYGSAEFERDIGIVPLDDEATPTRIGVSQDVDAFLLGVGLQYAVTDRLGIRADYTRFEANEDNIDGGFDTLTLGAVWTF